MAHHILYNIHHLVKAWKNPYTSEGNVPLWTEIEREALTVQGHGPGTHYYNI